MRKIKLTIQAIWVNTKAYFDHVFNHKWIVLAEDKHGKHCICNKCDRIILL